MFNVLMVSAAFPSGVQIKKELISFDHYNLVGRRITKPEPPVVLPSPKVLAMWEQEQEERLRRGLPRKQLFIVSEEEGETEARTGKSFVPIDSKATRRKRDALEVRTSAEYKLHSKLSGKHLSRDAHSNRSFGKISTRHFAVIKKRAKAVGAAVIFAKTLDDPFPFGADDCESWWRAVKVMDQEGMRYPGFGGGILTTLSKPRYHTQLIDQQTRVLRKLDDVSERFRTLMWDIDSEWKAWMNAIEKFKAYWRPPLFNPYPDALCPPSHPAAKRRLKRQARDAAAALEAQLSEVSDSDTEEGGHKNPTSGRRTPEHDPDFQERLQGLNPSKQWLLQMRQKGERIGTRPAHHTRKNNAIPGVTVAAHFGDGYRFDPKAWRTRYNLQPWLLKGEIALTSLEAEMANETVEKQLQTKIDEEGMDAAFENVDVDDSKIRSDLDQQYLQVVTGKLHNYPERLCWNSSASYGCQGTNKSGLRQWISYANGSSGSETGGEQ